MPPSNLLIPYVFLCDEPYPLIKNLVKPYSTRQLNQDKDYFNARLSRARRCVECAFGIINAKWRILWKPIECLPETADTITKCICVLHNTIIDKEGCLNVGMYETKQFLTRPSTESFNYYTNIRPTDQAKLIWDTFKTCV